MKVVHCYRDPYNTYVGRPSPFGNPFSDKKSKHPTLPVKTVGEAVAAYEAWLRRGERNLEVIKLGIYPDHRYLQRMIRALRDSAILGCYCKPGPCHGDIIKDVWMEMQAGGWPE